MNSRENLAAERHLGSLTCAYGTEFSREFSAVKRCLHSSNHWFCSKEPRSLLWSHGTVFHQARQNLGATSGAGLGVGKSVGS